MKKSDFEFIFDILLILLSFYAMLLGFDRAGDPSSIDFSGGGLFGCGAMGCFYWSIAFLSAFLMKKKHVQPTE